MDTPLVVRTRGADRYIVQVFDFLGVEVRRFDITAGQYAALALPGAGAPPGVLAQEGDRWFVTGGPDYDGARQLPHGGIVEFSDRFELGIQRRDGRLFTLTLFKSGLTVSRGGGLTLRAAAWPDGSEIVSIERGVLRTLD